MLREVREKAGLSLTELQERTGIHKSMLSQVELGQRHPSEALVEKLVLVLGCPELAEHYLTHEDVRKIRGFDAVVVAVKRLMKRMGI